MSYPKTVLVVTNGNYFAFESHPYRHDNYNYIVRQFCSKPYLIVMLNSVRLAHVAQLSPCCFIFYKRRILFWTSIFKYGIKAFCNYLPTCLTDSFYWPQTTLKLLIGCALYYFQVVSSSSMCWLCHSQCREETSFYLFNFVLVFQLLDWGRQYVFRKKDEEGSVAVDRMPMPFLFTVALGLDSGTRGYMGLIKLFDAFDWMSPYTKCG